MENILIFSPYYRNHIGGLEFFVEEFNKNLLTEKKYSITLVTSLIPKDQKVFEKKDNLEIIRLPFFELINNFPVPKIWSLVFWKGYLLLFKKKYSIVISHTRFFTTSIMAWFYSRNKKVKWIHFEHGSDFVQTKNKVVSFLSYVYDFLIGKFVLIRADKVVSISEAVSKFVFNLSKKPSTVIYRGFDFSKFKKVEPNKIIAKKYDGFLKIIFVGRLINGKGVDDLLSALEKIKTDKKWICFIVGDGDCKLNLIRHSNNKNLKNKIVFLGKLENSKALEIIKSCDLFINPSYTEGLPTTVIEAIVLKKPVIATDVGGTNECFNKKNDLICSGDIDSLLKKIQSFINDKKIDYNLDKNYEYVFNKFNWNNSIKKFINLIK